MIRTTALMMAFAGLAVTVSAQFKPRPILVPDIVDSTDTIDRLMFEGNPLTIANTARAKFSFSDNKFVTNATVVAGSTGEDQVMIVYDLDTDTAEVVLQEGVTTFAPNAAFTVGIEVATINDLGQLAIAVNGPQDLGGADPGDLLDRIVIGTPDGIGGYTFESAVVNGDELDGDSDRGNSNFGIVNEFRATSSDEFARVDNDGQLAYWDDNFISTGLEDPAAFADIDLNNKEVATFDGMDFNIFNDVTLIAIEEVTVGVVDPGPDNRIITDIAEIRFGKDGNIWMIEANLSGSSSDNEAVIVSGDVKAREGSVYDAAAQLATGVLLEADTLDAMDDPEMNGDGAFVFLARFASTGSVDWVCLDMNDGSAPRILTGEGQPVSPLLPGENWSSISDVQMNIDGDIAIIGSSDADSSQDSIAVYNNYLVVAREGTPVDLDPNTPGDEARLNRLDAFADGLANVGNTFVIARNDLKDSNGVDITPGNERSMLRVDFDPFDVNASGARDFFDVAEVLNVMPGLDFNFDGTPGDQQDVQDLISGF